VERKLKNPVAKKKLRQNRRKKNVVKRKIQKTKIAGGNVVVPVAQSTP
jgi:hypothetical protein